MIKIQARIQYDYVRSYLLGLLLSLSIYLSIYQPIYQSIYIYSISIRPSLSLWLWLCCCDLHPQDSVHAKVSLNKEKDPTWCWFVEKHQVRDPVRYGTLLIKETVRYDLSRRCDSHFFLFFASYSQNASEETPVLYGIPY